MIKYAYQAFIIQNLDDVTLKLGIKYVTFGSITSISLIMCN